MKKRMLSLAMAIILMLSLVPVAFAADSAAATREYAIAALAEAAGIAPAAGGLEGFADADTVSPQYRDGVAKAVAAGVVRGYEDGTLRPQAPVSRLEALVLLSRCLLGFLLFQSCLFGFGRLFPVPFRRFRLKSVPDR